MARQRQGVIKVDSKKKGSARQKMKKAKKMGSLKKWTPRYMDLHPALTNLSLGCRLMLSTGSANKSLPADMN